jgi:YHS domain-containing protein
MQIKCPVCHMQVASDRLTLVYQGMHFAFCSEQCRERFRTTPHLYVGVPGHKAAKQEGQQVLKRRCFRLNRPLSSEQGQALADAIAGMMGIKHVGVEDTEVRIVYDLLEATAEQIEARLLEAGARLGGDWTDRLRRALVHYTEDCETANLEVSDRGHHPSP